MYWRIRAETKRFGLPLEQIFRRPTGAGVRARAKSWAEVHDPRAIVKAAPPPSSAVMLTWLEPSATFDVLDPSDRYGERIRRSQLQ
jgi:hypothetical protein